MAEKRLTQILGFLEDDPDDPFLKYAVAMEYLSEDNTEQAATWLKKVLEEHPRYVAAYYQYALILYQNSMMSEAIEIVNKGIDEAKLAGNQSTLRELRQLLEDLED